MPRIFNVSKVVPFFFFDSDIAYYFSLLSSTYQMDILCSLLSVQISSFVL
jgi:hypothetical protein